MVNPSIKTHTVDMQPRKRIALIAHDYRKDDLLAWVSQHREKLEKHELFGTGTTGGLIADKLGMKIQRSEERRVGREGGAGWKRGGGGEGDEERDERRDRWTEE